MTKQRSGARASLPDLVEAAKAMGHPTRLRMLAMLAGGELCVCQMIAVLEVAPSTVSQHLSVLAHAGLVTERKEGRLVFYRLRPDGPGAALLPPMLGELASDPTAKQDARLVGRLRRVPVAKLCAAELNLNAVGVRRATATQTPATAP